MKIKTKAIPIFVGMLLVASAMFWIRENPLAGKDCYKCHSFLDNWNGKNIELAQQEYGVPTSKSPSDEAIAGGASRTVGMDSVQDWFYKNEKISFRVRRSDNKIIMAWKEDHAHILNWFFAF